jgi:hypothetical protein
MFTNSDNRILFDWSAVGISAGAFMDILPAISALLSIIWLSLRIWQTVKEMRNGRGD